MDDINTEFDDMTEISDVKDFEQSQNEPLSVFDVPMMYQEFDIIEHDIGNKEQKLNEITAYSDRFNNTRVVRRDDVLALESIVGDLGNLPHINSYTDDYSLVNYAITQESIFGKIREVMGDVLKSVWEFIMNTLETITTHFKSLFKSTKYRNTPKGREATVNSQEKAQTAIKKMTSPAMTEKRDSRTDDQNKQRVTRINKELRSLLYPAFTELTVLSRGGDIHPDLLIDEMCEQRFKGFYTTFFKALYENDYVLTDFMTLYSTMMNRDVDTLARRTEAFQSVDLTTPLAEPYESHYTAAPEQVKEFVLKFDAKSQVTGVVKDAKSEFRTYATIAHTTAQDIVNIAVSHELPEPRTLLGLNLESLAILDSVSMKTITAIEAQFKNMKKLKAKSGGRYPDVDPANKPSVTALYHDWLILNKAMLTTGIFLARLNSISNNYRTLMNYIIGVADILTD